jgi:hypothetical protein
MIKQDQLEATQRGGLSTKANTESAKFDGKHQINPLNTELNPICHLLALLGAHHILHISRIRVKTKQLQFHGASARA